MQVGDRYEEKVVISADLVQKFADFSRDFNPIHFQDEPARQQGFKGRIAHGMVSASLFSKIFATTFPGPGAVYLGQNLKFLSPVYVGETLKYVLTVKDKKPDKPIFTITTEAIAEDGSVKVAGEAVIRFA